MACRQIQLIPFFPRQRNSTCRDNLFQAVFACRTCDKLHICRVAQNPRCRNRRAHVQNLLPGCSSAALHCQAKAVLRHHRNFTNGICKVLFNFCRGIACGCSSRAALWCVPAIPLCSFRNEPHRPLKGGAYQLKVSFDSNPDEKIYGMGQYQQERMNLKGCNLELAHRNSQASIPFYVSSLGYGFLWHNAAVGEVHFGTNTTEWLARTTKQLDYWVTAGDTPAEIEEHFADAIGKVPMMPEYGLGFWQCKLRYYNQEQVLNVAREYKKRGIPLDVFVIDYYHWPRCGDYRFDEEYFPDPKAMIDELHEMGIETMVSIWPQIDWRSENYEEMKQQGLLVKSNAGVDVQMLFHGNNVFLDATNPRTRKYVWEKVKKNYADLGIRTFWLDEAEPEFSTYEYECYRYAAGPVEEIGNIYPREYSRMFYEGQKENGQEDIVNLVRCAWLGSQKYGALVWSGDIFSTYEDFRKQICAGLHMGLCGIPWWTTDIGGFHGGVTEDPDFQELLISEILTKFIGVREKMRDYTEKPDGRSTRKGTPVMRTMFWVPGGCSVLGHLRCLHVRLRHPFAAPIVRAKATSRTVYLPGRCVLDAGKYR